MTEIISTGTNVIVNGILPIDPKRGGVIKGYSIFENGDKADLHYIVELNYGFYNMEKNIFVSLLVVHNSNIEVQ